MKIVISFIAVAMCFSTILAEEKPTNPDLGPMYRQPPDSVKPNARVMTKSVEPTGITRAVNQEELEDNLTNGCNRRGITLTEPGTIISQNYPNNYKKNRNCKYTITAPEGKVVVVEITDFVVRCGGDYLKIWSTGYGTKKELCRNSNQPMIDRFYVSDSNEIKMQFKTNRNKQARGFSLYYWFQDRHDPCNGNAAVLNSDFAVVQYPSVFQGDYGNNQNCSWLVSAPEDAWLRLTLHQVDIESHSTCSYDRLSVYPGASLYDQVGEGICGSFVSNESILVPINQAVFNFISDYSEGGAGFTASYEIVDGVRACGVNQPENMTALQGVIAVDYAENYDDNMQCSWYINVPSGYGIQLSVNFFHLEEPQGSTCAFDKLQIFRDNDHFVDQWCGYLEPGHTGNYMSNNLLLSFTSDSSVTAAGFSITYTAVEDSVIPTTTPPSSTTPAGPIDDMIGLYVSGMTVHHGQCGIPVITPSLSQTRIVGGSEATPHSYPWIVSVQDNSGFHYCAGTILSDRWVATAAHCVVGDQPSEVRLVLGEHHLSQTETPRTVTIGVEQIIAHEEYNDNTIENDIALFYTDTAITFTDVVWPACLPTEDYETNQPTCVIAGWGETEGSGNYRKLQQANVPIITEAQCTAQGWAYDPSEIYESNFCAGYEDGGIDTCQGDSGGPLVCPQDDGSWHLHGVVSWGYGCADYKSPGIYTRVSHYYSWITNAILNQK